MVVYGLEATAQMAGHIALGIDGGNSGFVELDRCANHKAVALGDLYELLW